MQHKQHLLNISSLPCPCSAHRHQDGVWGVCPAPPADRVSGTDVDVILLAFRLSLSTALEMGPTPTLGTLEDVEITADGATSPSDCISPKAEPFVNDDVSISDGLLGDEGICGLSSIGVVVEGIPTTGEDVAGISRVDGDSVDVSVMAVDGFSNAAAASALATSAALLSISCIRFCTIAGISCTYVPIKR